MQLFEYVIAHPWVQVDIDLVHPGQEKVLDVVYESRHRIHLQSLFEHEPAVLRCLQQGCQDKNCKVKSVARIVVGDFVKPRNIVSFKNWQLELRDEVDDAELEPRGMVESQDNMNDQHVHRQH